MLGDNVRCVLLQKRCGLGDGVGGLITSVCLQTSTSSGGIFLGCFRKQMLMMRMLMMIMMRMLMMMDAFKHIKAQASRSRSEVKNATETIAKRRPITCASMLGSLSSDACMQIPAKLWQSCVKLSTSATV